MIVPVVSKPFQNYKWRWASVAPTESLNHPEVFLGVLRAMRKHEFVAPSEPVFINSLANVEKDAIAAGYSVDLSRTGERNLLRNSQQYWKAPGVLGGTEGGIKLTPFGRDVADGYITKEEFAATVVRTLELPNRALEPNSVLDDWDKAKLKIHPLDLLLRIILSLLKNHDVDKAYLTPREVSEVVVPLVLVTQDAHILADHVVDFRIDPSKYSKLPNCTPSSNDRRMVREFLLFLSYYEFLKLKKREKNEAGEFHVTTVAASAIETSLALNITTTDWVATAALISKEDAIVAVEREKRLIEIVARPQQAKFRKDVLKACSGKCIISGETMPEVLKACHIIEVKDKGPDTANNGLCLRSDLHDLFDSGHLRIAPDGQVSLSKRAAKSSIYSRLPKNITIPPHCSIDAIRRRFEYK